MTINFKIIDNFDNVKKYEIKNVEIFKLGANVLFGQKPNGECIYFEFKYLLDICVMTEN